MITYSSSTSFYGGMECMEWVQIDILYPPVCLISAGFFPVVYAYIKSKEIK